MSSLESYKLILKPLTPIIIGSGEELEAYEYVVHEEDNGQKYFYAINWLEYINTLPVFDRGKIVNVIESADVMQIRKFLFEKTSSIVSKKNCIRFQVLIDKEASAKYEGDLSDPKNELVVKLLIRSGDKSYIPGSSLKGAIRTSFLYEPAREYIKRPGAPISRLGNRLEKILLNYDTTFEDPFRSLKIGDSKGVNSKIVFIQRKQLKHGRWNDMPFELREALNPAEEGEIEMPITLDSRSKEKAGSFRYSISRNWIAEKCRNFYGDVYKEEVDFFKQYASDAPVIDPSWKGLLEDAINGTKEDGYFPVRLGWGSGKAGMAISIVLREDDPPITRRLIKHGNEYQPIGWAVCKMVTK